jgi:hypothetical protein
MNGKNKCKILKDIRRQIAENNEIAYVTTECKFQGECTGTCPKCEAEVRYLEEELAKRQKAGKAVAVAGIAAALVVGTAGCALNLFPQEGVLAGEVPYEAVEETTEPEELDEVVLMGDVAVDMCPTEPEEPLMGEPAE